MPQRCDLATQEARHEERQEGGKQGEWRTRACGRRKRYASASAQGASQYACERRESPGGLSALEEEVLEGEQKVGERTGESREVRQGERHAERARHRCEVLVVRATRR